MDSINAHLRGHKEAYVSGTQFAGIALGIVALPSLLALYGHSPMRVWRGSLLDIVLFESAARGLKAICPLSAKTLAMIAVPSTIGWVGTIALHFYCKDL